MKKRGSRKLKFTAAVGCAAALLVTPVSALASSQSADKVEVNIHPSGHHSGLHKLVSSTEKDVDLADYAQSAVIMDFATKKVLFEKSPNKELPMASITKIMTMLLAMEAIEKGQMKLSDTITSSEHAASMGGSQIFLEPGEKMSLNDMMKGIAMASANDACVAIAEHMTGTETAFVKRMNRRAKELGMEHTHFVNCNGLPANNHYSSAKDVAIMSRELLKHPQITKWTSVYSDYLRENSSHPLWLVNTNKLVRFYDGMDGLKTGYTSEAKYCLSATAKRNGFRVIAVAMGEPKITVRNREITQMLDWTFGQYTSKVLYKPNQVIQQIRIPHGVPERVDIKTVDTVGVIQPKGEKRSYETQVHLDNVKAPIKKEQKVGTLQVLNDDDVVVSAPLVAVKSVRKANLFESIGQTTRHLFTFGKH